MSLLESAKYIVPVSKSAPEQVSALRQIASGKFISADKPGIYEYNPQSQQNQDEGRRIQV
jgi:hypothetical protein